jgi:exportin-T
MDLLIMTPLELERWVLLASDGSRPQLQWEANTILHRWSAQEQATELANVLLQVLVVTHQEPVLFYALTTLQRLDLAPDQRVSLRQYLLNTFSTTTITNRSIYLRTKVGVVLAHLIRCDFPHHWPTAFGDLMQPALLHASPDIFLRTLDALMEDFGMNENDINRHLKDVLREPNPTTANTTSLTTTTTNNNNNSNHASTTTPTTNSLSSLAARCMQTVLSILGHSYTVILSFANSPSSSSSSGNMTMNGYGQQPQLGTALQLAALALTVLKHFISWVDLAVILDEELQVLSLIFALLKVTSSASTFNGGDDPGGVAVLAVACLHELVGRGMEDHKKIGLLRDTDLLQRIYLHVNLDTVDASPIEVVLEVAKLINLTGLELLPLWDEATTSTSSSTNGNSVSEQDAMILTTLLQQLLDLFFRCFAYDDIDVSGAVIPLASRLAVSMTKEESTTTNGSSGRNLRQHLPRLFAVMYRQMKYPADFRYDYEDEDEAEEEMYRTELRKLNQRLVRVAPEMALQFLCTTLANLPVPISQSPTPDLEAALRLVYHYCEGIQPSPGLKVVMRLEVFCNVLVALHNSDITAHDHREVLTLYYETAVRYHSIFKDHPDLLLKVLEAMSGPHGLQHSHPRVRSRSCYLLLRLVKAVTALMRPYVETAITGIQGLLSNPTQYDLRTEDTMYLFETIGLLLGKTQLGEADRQRYLRQVIQPHIQAMEQAISSLAASGDQEQNGSVLASSIAAIANLSKGNSTKPTDTDDVLLDAIRVTLSALEALPRNDQVRSKSMILLQRMIQCIGNNVLPPMPRFLSLLVENCTSEDILDVAQLYNQLCIRFKQDAAPVLDQGLLPFLEKCRSLMPSTSEVVASGSNGNNPQYIPPHLRTEQLSIQKLAFIVLHHIVMYRVTDVLISPTNANHLTQLLQTMSEGAIHVEDASVKKTCLSFFRELLVQWLEADSSHATTRSTSMNAVLLVQFVSDVLVPSMFRCFLLDPAFQADDALQSRNIVEFAQILSVLRRTPSSLEVYSNAVSSTLGGLGCPQQLSEAFLKVSSAEDISSQLRELIKAVKTKTTA